MFNQSAERFAEIMQGMKQMAAEMQQELETTRAELRRGIFELPQETAESAAQMRRVIVDQIEALAELNRIVARHGRSLDTVRADAAGTAASAGAPAPRPEPLRREAEPAYVGGGARRRRGRRDITGAPPAATRRHHRRSAAPARTAAARPEWRRRQRPQQRRLAQRSFDARVARGQPADRAAGRRAAKSARRATSADSLESLAVDVARMIDHEAAADLWERYKRGERGLFTRRLYTAQGQKAFDEIRRKYRADPEFRQTVEQYIHEFERLLDDVSRGDRGAAVVRNYLTSDTGKVYTMLAHAAGRFDQ